jgi:hypothetical protein
MTGAGDTPVDDSYVAVWSREHKGQLVICDAAGKRVSSYVVTPPGDRPGPEILLEPGPEILLEHRMGGLPGRRMGRRTARPLVSGRLPGQHMTSNTRRTGTPSRRVKPTVLLARYEMLARRGRDDEADLGNATGCRVVCLSGFGMGGIPAWPMGGRGISGRGRGNS